MKRLLLLAQLGLISSSACDDVRTLCKEDPSVMFRNLADLRSTVVTLVALVANCSAPQAEYEEVLAVADKFILGVTETPLYAEMIAANRLRLMDTSSDDSIVSVFKQKLALMGGWEHYSTLGNVIRLVCPAADFDRYNDFQLFGGSFDGLSLIYGLSAFNRHLISIGCSSQTKEIMRRAASVAFLFFSELQLDSPSYLTNNLFQAQEGREDIVDALVELKALYPQVGPASKVALLKYAGAMRIGFSSIEGTTGALIWDIRKPLLLEDPLLTEPFLSRMSEITTATALFIKGKAKSPASKRIPYPVAATTQAADVSAVQSVTRPVEVVITEDVEEAHLADEEAHAVISAAPASADGPLAELQLVESSAAPKVPAAPRQVDTEASVSSTDPSSVEWFDEAALDDEERAMTITPAELQVIGSVIEAVHEGLLEELGVAIMPAAAEYLEGNANWVLNTLAEEIREMDAVGDEPVTSPLLMHQETEYGDDDMEGVD